jgi:hypothetical protein
MPSVSGSTESRRVSMACLGRTGRWGNTLMSYFFLRAFAQAHALVPEVPRWIGQDFFGRLDDPITHAHPLILYDMVSEICQDRYQHMVTASMATGRARRLREAGRHLVPVREPLLDEFGQLPATSVDLEGLYFVHTHHLARYRDLLRRVAQPLPALEEGLTAAWRDLRRRGDIVIGLHVRRGDFDVKFSHVGFEFVAPIEWYISWLDRLWGQHERPVLFVASDSLPKVLPALARYNPITIQDLEMRLAPELRELDLPAAHVQKDADFLPEWFLLTRCHALAISNSTFSFTAAMMNETATVFVRPDPQMNALVPFDPWDSEPLLFLPPTGNLLLEVLQRLSMAQRGMGLRATLPNVSRALRWYGQVLRARATASRHYSGTAGLLREFLRPQFYLSVGRRYDEGSAEGGEADLPVPPRAAV